MRRGGDIARDRPFGPTRSAAVAALALLTALAAHARADDAPEERAKVLFNVGAQAYAQGDFDGAVDAFEEAYRAEPRPGLLFSIAQALRKQYYVAHDAARLRAAIEHYHAYLGKVSTGKFRVIAAEALAELEPIAAKEAPEGAATPPPPPKAAAEKPRTRVMVSSAVPGARVSLDGAPAQPSPLIADVTPGEHAVRVEAEGFVDDTRPLTAVEGGLVALDVPLRERPARLVVHAEIGADVAVDRRPIGRVPLPGPIELPAGRHFVTLVKNGRRPFGEEVTLARGEERSVDVALGVTRQRVASYLLAASAGVGAIVGGAFVGAAYHEQSVAESILTTSATRTISEKMLGDYGAALGAREDFKRAAYGVLGGALAFGVVAGALFVFDTPEAPSTFGRFDEGPARKAPAPAPLEVSALPLAGPGLLGAAVVGKFQ